MAERLTASRGRIADVFYERDSPLGVRLLDRRRGMREFGYLFQYELEDLQTDLYQLILEQLRRSPRG